MRIHFICRGNAYRSLMAEAYFNSLGLKDVIAVSSGSVADANIEKNIPNLARSVALLERNGLGAYTKRASHQLSNDRIEKDDIVVCMNQRAYDESVQIVPLPKDTIVWDITDMGEEADPPSDEEARIKHAEYTLERIKEKVDELVASNRAVFEADEPTNVG